MSSLKPHIDTEAPRAPRTGGHVLTRFEKPQPLTCSGLTTLAELEHFKIAIDAGCSLVVVWRTPSPFTSLPGVKDAFSHLASCLELVDRAEYKLLGDTRRGPSRNDAAFEQELSSARLLLLAGWSCNATIAKTLVGQLQIRRYAQQDGRMLLVTSNPAEAFVHLGVPYHHL